MCKQGGATVISCLHEEQYETKRKEARTEGYLQASTTGSRNKEIGIVWQKKGTKGHVLGKLWGVMRHAGVFLGYGWA